MAAAATAESEWTEHRTEDGRPFYWNAAMKKTHLKKNKVQFYTHGKRSVRPHRVVMRGLPNAEPDYVKELLKTEHQLDVLAIMM
ncbi:conserved hypothetical protein [Culex quinquefasciatus]|uniref:WW domain-containing protein n=1 Tax=Culex quinquefasciatus TaxID=7176 RepID=B0X5K4_CULQU|nr:conserved hypothetical protein [Culex quinquefasciatus]|eukprot:XP_001864926.1 conserved hypothetical protein [Culex quinquefasciatus]